MSGITIWASCDQISGNISAAEKDYKVRTEFLDPETSVTCHGAYYGDQQVWTKILLDVYSSKR